MAQNFFPDKPNSNPTIYAYEDTNPELSGLLKVGYTSVDVQKRVSQQYPTLRPGKSPYNIVFQESSVRNDGSVFTDHEIHKCLKKRGVLNPEGEWFKCTVKEIKAAFLEVKEGIDNLDSRSSNFKLRPEQLEAINKTEHYFKTFNKDNNKTPHFLWNAKMRFGKTFAAYKLAQKMNWNRLLVLTFKPAVQSAWEEDLRTHIDFEGWQFISNNGKKIDDADFSKPIVCFGSFQDFLGKNSAGGIKAKNEWVHTMNWDCVILDEYHYGAWRESAKDLFESEDSNISNIEAGEGLEYFEEDNMPITTSTYLYLSGTPFRAITSGEFIEEQIFNWTYTDEQYAKENWQESNNPYLSLPRMVLLTYQLPPSI